MYIYNFGLVGHLNFSCSISRYSTRVNVSQPIERKDTPPAFCGKFDRSNRSLLFTLCFIVVHFAICLS